jgi:prevent-host-death family protein
MSTTVNIHAAKTRFSQLVEAAEAGEEIVIARAGKPVARLVPLQASRSRRRLGRLADRGPVPPEFCAPLPDEVIDRFEQD